MSKEVVQKKDDKNVKKIEVEDDGYVEVEATTSGLLLGIIQQIKMGIEMSKVIIPCEFLEPRSLLERLSDMMSHIDYALEAYNAKSAEERMLIVLRWYLSSWYIRPKGVKKPYNPVLGEVFKCKFYFLNRHFR
jgi:oxysterol-binding protein-related protein 8